MLLVLFALLDMGCRRHAGHDVMGPDRDAAARIFGTPTPAILFPSEAAITTPPTFSLPASEDDERLDARFASPQGFDRVEVEAGSFGAFLRGLPVRPADAPVVDFRGRRLYDDGHDPSIAAVVDLDIGTADLQQCSDSVERLNAEWHYARGDRGMKFTAAAGPSLGYPAYLAGERTVADQGKLHLAKVAARSADNHKVFRSYLDEVFAWADTTSLARDSQPVALLQAMPGDFFVMTEGRKGHAVLVLDVALDRQGRTALLLGQGYMPAQSFHVLRVNAATAWFIVEPNATQVATPFWKPFPIETLRRLP
jgi:hypothetical protein